MNPQQHVVFALVGAFLMFALDHEIFTAEKTKIEAGGDTTQAFIQRYMAWGFLFFILLAASDIPTVSPLSVAFAWLIFLSIFFTSGIHVFGRINSMIDPSPAVPGSGHHQ